ncbi:MAG: hypothetical protein H7X80_12080, partial [bacterium]|nr:hypothetical protein [Candidatus Kapabacteria bacterium]
FDSTLGGFSEEMWGINGSVGVSINIRVPYLTISPTGELRALRILGERPLVRRRDEFFVSQVRLGLILYPDFKSMFR